MGMYDDMSIVCVKCGMVTKCQSKAGVQTLEHFTVTNAPFWFLRDNDIEPGSCEHCGSEIDFRIFQSVNCEECSVIDELIDALNIARLFIRAMSAEYDSLLGMQVADDLDVVYRRHTVDVKK